MNKNKIIKYVDLNSLPKKPNGKIDWKKSAGYKIPFVYQDIVGDIQIIDWARPGVIYVYIDGYTMAQYDIAYTAGVIKGDLGRLLRKKIINTHPELVQYFVDKNDALRYSTYSNEKIKVQCPLCGYIKEQIITNLSQRGFSCPICSDGISYPNKLMFNILKQLKISFINEVSKKHKGFEWVEKYKYDFFIIHENKKYFIEMDGGFHYGDFFITYEEAQTVDREKDRLSKLHNVHMIRIDCNYKTEKDKFLYIKNNILRSELSTMFDLSSIDWNTANLMSTKSKIIMAADLWTEGNSTSFIAQELGIEKHSVCNYLKLASDVGLCDYNNTAKTRAIKNRTEAAIKARNKPILVQDANNNIRVFCSAAELERQSDLIYGVHIWNANIRKVCSGQLKHTAGLSIKYITKEEYEQFCLQSNNTKLM